VTAYPELPAVMKLICPHCLKSVSVPEDAAGKEATCPECGRAFPAPARYNPVVAAESRPTPRPPAPVIPEPNPMPMDPTPPPAPPGLIPPTHPSTQLEPPLPPEPPAPPVPAGYTRSVGVPISPRVVAWVPVAGLTLAFLFTFFTWVGAYYAHHPVAAQSAWRSMVGSVARDYALEDAYPGRGPWVDKVRSDWEVMLPYLFTLILTVVFAWAERGVASLDRYRLPPPLRWLPRVWPYRQAVIAGLAAVSLAFLLIQMAAGFGLERAVDREVSERVAERRQQEELNAAGKGKAPTDARTGQARLDYLEQQERARYNVHRTTWLYLALWLHVLAILAIAARAGLDRRGTRPPPRIVVQY
jgi:hypothetical protein